MRYYRLLCYVYYIQQKPHIEVVNHKCNYVLEYSDSDEELDNRYGSTLQYEDDKKSTSNGRKISSTDKKTETPQKR